MKTISYVIVTGLLATASATALARQDHPMGLNALDKDYLKAAAQSNLEEIQFESTVRSHAASDAVRQFGQQMKRDHSAANAELKRVAANVRCPLPKEVSEDQKHIMARLAQFHGAQFDPVYKLEMVHDHTADIAEAEREISLGSNPAVVANAKKTLELLREHLKMSEALPGGDEKTASVR